MKYWREAVAVIIVSAFISGMSVYFLHYKLIDEGTGKYYSVLHWQVINKKAKAPTQYRPFAYWLAEVLTKEVKSKESAGPPSNVNVSDETRALIKTYQDIRFFFTFLTGLLIYLLFRAFFKAGWAFCGLLWFFTLLSFTYQSYMHQPGDPINLFLFCIAYILIQRGWSEWLWPLLVIGVPNRETVLLIPIIDIFSKFDEKPIWKTAARFIIFTAIGFGLYLLIHKHYGEPERGQLPFITLQTNCENPKWFLPAFYVFGPLIAITIAGFKHLPALIKRWFGFGIFFIIFHIVLGRFCEVRLLQPVIPLMVLSSCLSLRRLLRTPK